MATVYVTEYVHAAVDQGKALPVGFGPPTATQVVGIGGSSSLSAPFGPNTTLIRVHSDSICSVLVGTTNTTTATATGPRMAAGQTEYFGVAPGMVIAVISNV